MMYFNNLNDFLSMGGYGLYVWGSFGVTALVVIAEIMLARKHRAVLCDELNDFE
jgi:heme exporter protein D